MQTAPHIFLNLMFKLFFKYLDEFLVFWIDDLLIYSQMEGKHWKHLDLVFKKLGEAGIKFENVKMWIFQERNWILRTLSVRWRYIPNETNIKVVTGMTPTTNVTEARHIIGLVGYYRKFFPIFSNTIRSLHANFIQITVTKTQIHGWQKV